MTINELFDIRISNANVENSFFYKINVLLLIVFIYV